ncbi:hypothetical protein Tco_0178905 [Tanacetum coccineum]
MAEPITNDYISTTCRSFVSKDSDGKMIKKNFIEIEGAFLVKIRNNTFSGNEGDDVFKYINSFLEVVEPIKHDEEEETEDEDYDPHSFGNVPEILKIEDDLFLFDTPLVKTYEEYAQELNDKTQGDMEPWSEIGVQHQLCDHICEPYRFKNGKAKWPTYNSDVDGFYNGGELPGMVRVGTMTYFQDHSWYNELVYGRLKDETLAFKAKVERSWGDATQGVLKFCKWLKICFENFHELEYEVLVKLQECWWRVNILEVAPFARKENFRRGPYANTMNKWGE